MNFDATGTRRALVADIMDSFEPSQHPEVLEGHITARVAFQQLARALERYADEEGFITAEDFEDYFSNLSSFIESDQAFEQMIRGTFRVDFTPAPPPEYRVYHGQIQPVHLSATNHGNIVTWQQRPSKLEERANSRVHRTQSVQERHNYIVTDWSSQKEEPEDNMNIKRKKFMDGGGPLANLSEAGAFVWDDSEARRKQKKNKSMFSTLSTQTNAEIARLSVRGHQEEEEKKEDFGFIRRSQHPLDLRPRVLNERVKQNLHGHCPFDVETSNGLEQKQEDRNLKPKSLSDFLS
jgi:hypothetical protein